jgi:hypothetical protein
MAHTIVKRLFRRAELYFNVEQQPLVTFLYTLSTGSFLLGYVGWLALAPSGLQSTAL